MNIEMGIGINQLGIGGEQKKLIDKHIEKIVSESPVWKKYAEEYANKFVIEKRLPLKQEYYEMMDDLSEKVMKEDETIHKKLMFAVLKETILNQEFISELKKEFQEEIEAQEAAKEQDSNNN